MLKKKFNDIELSLLGLDIAHLPLLKGEASEKNIIDAKNLLDYAISHEVNYYDIGWTDHKKPAVKIVADMFKKYDRSTYYLANIFPVIKGEHIGKAKELFEEQLEVFGTEKFDFYTIRGLNNKNLDYFIDDDNEDWNYFVEQKKNGRISYLGISAFGSIPTLQKFLEKRGNDVDYCQLQVNYYDWRRYTILDKIELLDKWDIPIWAMEPLKNGRLGDLKEEYMEILRMLNANESAVNWAFKFTKSAPSIRVVSSGISNISQLKENIRIFSERERLGAKELAMLYGIADDMIENEKREAEE